MRFLLLAAAALGATVPAAAFAEDGCPGKVTAETLTAFGSPAATLTGGQTIYQPSGLTMLGLPVGYVVVTKGSGDAVEEIDYRFDGVMRKYSDRYPKNVLTAFDKAYDGASCASGKVTSCALAFDSKGGTKPGQLTGAKIGEADIDVPKDAPGVLGTVKSDFGQADSGPVFLVCLY